MHVLNSLFTETKVAVIVKSKQSALIICHFDESRRCSSRLVVLLLLKQR
jgi:hypothetical protein